MNQKLLSIVLFLIVVKSVAQQDFVISAHRGNSSEAPENTLIANQLAIDAKADYVECDVRRTRDGVMVTLHDSSLNRTTNTRGYLRSFNYSQLVNVDAGYSSRFGNLYRGERIPTLRQVLNQAKGRIKVEIELKESGLADDAVALVRELNMENDVIIISFNFSELRRVKQISTIPVKYLVSFFWGSRNLRQLQSIGGEFFGPPGVVSRSRVAEAKNMGIKIISYTIDSERDMRLAIQNGQYGIATNYPRRAVAVRSELERNNATINSIPVLAFPNPISTNFKINKSYKNALVRLINRNGEELVNYGLIEEVDNFEFKVNQNSGDYLLEIITGSKREVVPVIIN